MSETLDQKRLKRILITVGGILLAFVIVYALYMGIWGTESSWKPTPEEALRSAYEEFYDEDYNMKKKLGAIDQNRFSAMVYTSSRTEYISVAYFKRDSKKGYSLSSLGYFLLEQSHAGGLDDLETIFDSDGKPVYGFDPERRFLTNMQYDNGYEVYLDGQKNRIAAFFRRGRRNIVFFTVLVL